VEIRAKILRNPQTLPASTPMVLSAVTETLVQRTNEANKILVAGLYTACRGERV